MTYDPALYTAALFVCDKVAEGFTLTRACREAAKAYAVSVTPYRFRQLLAQSRELAEAFENAEQCGHDVLADSIVDIDSDPIHGCTDPKMAAVLSKNRQWFLSRRNQKRYGDKMVVTHEITADRAITDALARARTRAALPAPVVEDVVFDVVEIVEDESEEAILRSIGAL